MSCTAIVSAVSDAILALAGVVTAGVAIYGVKSWARELRGRATFEVARALARATYKLRESIRQARSPLIRGYEFPEDYVHAAVKSNPESEARAYAHIFTQRLAPVWVAYEEFDAQTLEAEALWGSPARLSSLSTAGAVPVSRRPRGSTAVARSHLGVVRAAK